MNNEAIMRMDQVIYSAIGSNHPPSITDAVIAHLWEEADDPEVVQRMQEAIHPWGMQPKLAREFLMAGLIALLGPKPEGDEG